MSSRPSLVVGAIYDLVSFVLVYNSVGVIRVVICGSVIVFVGNTA